MAEGKSEYKAKEICTGFEREMQETANEYYEEMRP